APCGRGLGSGCGVCPRGRGAPHPCPVARRRRGRERSDLPGGRGSEEVCLMSEDNATPPVQHEQDEPTPTPVLEPGYTYASVTDKISAITLSRGTPPGWWVGFGLAFLLVMVLLFAITYLLAVGIGIWGVNMPVAWGFAIVNFVWWIGIGHAGTLISAILLLM